MNERAKKISSKEESFFALHFVLFFFACFAGDGLIAAFQTFLPLLYATFCPLPLSNGLHPFHAN